MTKDQAIDWLRACAAHFEKRAANAKEDADVAAMQNNADNARQIANMILFNR